jgi:hypothetical protein
MVGSRLWDRLNKSIRWLQPFSSTNEYGFCQLVGKKIMAVQMEQDLVQLTIRPRNAAIDLAPVRGPVAEFGLDW